MIRILKWKNSFFLRSWPIVDIEQLNVSLLRAVEDRKKKSRKTIKTLFLPTRLRKKNKRGNKSRTIRALDGRKRRKLNCTQRAEWLIFNQCWFAFIAMNWSPINDKRIKANNNNWLESVRNECVCALVMSRNFPNLECEWLVSVCVCMFDRAAPFVEINK